MTILLREMREKRGWTQIELSRRSGVPQPMISEIESQAVKDPRVGTLYRLARALRCMIEDMIEEDNPSHD